MSAHSNNLDISQELILCRYRDGVILERPRSQDQYNYSSISALYSLPFNSYFYNANHQFVGGNDACLEIVGVLSPRDFIGSTNEQFADKELSILAEYNNDLVMRSERMIIKEESGFRKDDYRIQTLSFKFPWYAFGKVAGILGCSIITSKIGVSELANSLSQLVSIGLLNNNHYSIGSSVDTQKKFCPNLTPRENEVLSLWLRSKTAKEIGRDLNIGYKVVQKHIANIKFKTGGLSRSSLYDKFA